MTGVEMIAIERRRQIEKEGRTAEHDDQHDSGDLAVNAATLAVNGTDAEVLDPLGRGTPGAEGNDDGDAWGLLAKHGYCGKGVDETRCLVIAGALIAAEIDRLARMKKADEKSSSGG